MNEEIEYAEMLEIPVSTVNVVRKKGRKKAHKNADLKEDLITRVNEKINRDRGIPEADGVFAEEAPQEEGAPAYAEYGERIDTVLLPDRQEKRSAARGKNVFLNVEFAIACALCGGIFLTNVFMPTSAINTFFRSLNTAEEKADERTYSDFELSAVLGEGSHAEITVSPTGILSFTSKGHVYPAVDGKVAEVTENGDGTFDLRVTYSDDFYGVVSGLNVVYYAAGDEVRANIPVGYTQGESAVRVMLYSEGALLNCFTVDEEGNPAWIEKTE